MNVKTTFNTAIDTAKRNSPFILLVTGALAFGASAFFSWRAGKKHDEVMNEIRIDISEVKGIEPAEDEQRKYKLDCAKAYLKAGWKLGKIYGPAVLAETIGYISTFKAFGITNTRARNSLAACLVAEKGFSEYRKRVIETLGKDADEEFRFGIKELETDIPELDKNGVPKIGKDGNPKTKKKKIKYMENDIPKQASMYARMWDRYSTSRFETLKTEDILGNMVDTDKADRGYNLDFLQNAQKIFNQKLTAYRGSYVWLADVYEFLGYPQTAASRAVGWYYDPDRTDGEDNFIDFGIKVLGNESAYDIKRKREFDMGACDTILLDFNVNGNIMPLVFPELKKEGA